MQLLLELVGVGQALQQLEVGAPDDAGDHVGLPAPGGAPALGGGGDALDDALGQDDLPRLAHAVVVVPAHQEPEGGHGRRRHVVGVVGHLLVVAVAEELGQPPGRGPGMVAPAGLDHRELGHVAGDAAAAHERAAVGGHRDPTGLEDLVGEVAAHPQHAVVRQRGAAVGRHHHAVLAHHGHRQSHRRIVATPCDGLGSPCQVGVGRVASCIAQRHYVSRSMRTTDLSAICIGSRPPSPAATPDVEPDDRRHPLRRALLRMRAAVRRRRHRPASRPPRPADHRGGRDRRRGRAGRLKRQRPRATCGRRPRHHPVARRWFDASASGSPRARSPRAFRLLVAWALCAACWTGPGSARLLARRNDYDAAAVGCRRPPE